jgi:hypothetical protein
MWILSTFISNAVGILIPLPFLSAITLVGFLVPILGRAFHHILVLKVSDPQDRIGYLQGQAPWIFFWIIALVSWCIGYSRAPGVVMLPYLVFFIITGYRWLDASKFRSRERRQGSNDCSKRGA